MEEDDLDPDEVDKVLEGRVELVRADAADSQSQLWQTRVWEAYRNRCCSCGSEDHLKAKMIVPEEAGGQKTVDNATLICRTCELAAEIYSRSKVPGSGENTRPINFWIARPLHARLKNGLSYKYGFNSLASLVRFLMSKYNTDPRQFDDVANYIDKGSDLKVNVWVPRDMYERFQVITNKNGLTVTDALRGLLRMYGTEAERIFRRPE